MIAGQLGELAALGAAACWAGGTLLFSRVAAPAAAINLGKNTISAALLAIALACLGGAPLLHVDRGAVAWLAASAFVGLFIGDTCHFRCLQVLGPRRTIVIETLAPLFGVTLGAAFLGERLAPVQLAGVALTLVGVLIVLVEPGHADEAAGHFPGRPLPAIGFGVAAAFCQALGATWSKQGIRRLEALGVEGVRVGAEAALVRVTTAVVLGVLGAALLARLGVYARALVRRDALAFLVPGATLGTAIGVPLSMIAFQNAPIGVATTLTATSPLWMLPLVRIFLGQQITRRALLGAITAVAGVGLLFAA